MAGSKSPKVADDNLFSDDYVEAVIGLCEGPIGGLVLGSRSFYLGDTPLVAADGTSNFNPFELHIYHGAPEPTPIFQALGGPTSSSSVGITLAQNTPVVRVTDQSLRNKIDQLEIRMMVNALSLTTDKGDVENYSVTFKIAYRQVGATAWQYPYDDGVITLTGKTTSGYAKEFAINVPRTNGDWEIQITKLSADNETKRTSVISWESFQMVTKELKKYPNLAVAKIFGKASDQLQSIPTLSGVYHTKIIKVPSNYDVITRSYNGIWDGTFKLAVCDNPAWVMYDLLTDETYGFRKYNRHLQVDRFSFYEAAKWCDQLVPIPGGGFEPRWTYNEEISQARNALEMLYYIAGIFGGVPLTNRDNMVRLAVDRPATPVQIFGPESVVNGEFAYQFTDVTQRVNDVTVKFVNPNLGWSTDARRVFDQDLIDRNGPITENIIAVGCLSPSEGSRRGFRRIIQANTEKTSVTFKTTRAAIHVELLDVIGISDPDMLWGVSGRIKAVSEDTILLRDALYLPANTDLTMQIAHAGGPTTVTVRSATVVSKTLTVVSGALPSNLPQFAQFTLAHTELGLVKPFRVLSIDEDAENPDLVQISALELNINKYGDVDNLISTGTVDYQSNLKLQPSAPVNVVLESGDNYVITLADGAKVNRMRISWDYNPRALIKSFQLFYRDKATDTFQKVEVTGRSHYIERVIPGHTMEVYLTSINVNGVASVPSETVSHLVQGRQNKPGKAIDWVGQPGVKNISLSGPEADIPDFSHHLIRMYNSSNQQLDKATISGTMFTRQINDPANDPVAYYRVAIVDRTGNQGDFSDPIPVRARSLGNEDVAEDLTVPVIVDVLPELPSGIRLAFLTTNSKLYRNDGNQWTATVQGVDVDGRGLDILDYLGNTMFGSNGYINPQAYVSTPENIISIGEMAANALVPALNYVGEFPTAPTAVELGTNWKQNAVYKNSSDGKSYVLTGSPLSWVEYLADGLMFQTVIESSAGTTFKVGQGRSTLLKARLFKNGAEVTDSTPASWFRWRRMSSIPQDPPNDDATFNVTYQTGFKELSIDVDQVFSRATFFCDIISS